MKRRMVFVLVPEMFKDCELGCAAILFECGFEEQDEGASLNRLNRWLLVRLFFCGIFCTSSQVFFINFEH